MKLMAGDSFKLSSKLALLIFMQLPCFAQQALLVVLCVFALRADWVSSCRHEAVQANEFAACLFPCYDSPMRLTQHQQRTICETVFTHIGADARIWLFGSRCNENARGGDVDLLVENETLPSTMQRAQVKLALEASLEMPVDIIGIKRGAQPTAFQRIALATGISLGDVR
ncbi:MAG: nucleotidyltransferase domain-containing protein [Gallionellaceae bacterium]